MTNFVRVVVNLHVLPESEIEFLESWGGHAEECRSEEGNVQFELFRSVAFPENFAILELWESEAAFRKHFEADSESRVDRSGLVHIGTRRSGDDGLEIYYEQKRFVIENGIPVETQQRGWATK